MKRPGGESRAIGVRGCLRTPFSLRQFAYRKSTIFFVALNPFVSIL